MSLRNKLSVVLPLLFALGISASSCSSDSTQADIFEVRVENLTQAPIATTSTGAPLLAILSPGAFVVHQGNSPAYTVGQSLPANGFESYAEDADFNPFFDSIRFTDDIELIGFVNEYENETEDAEAVSENGFLGPDRTYRFVISANNKESKLSLFLQLVESNDVIFGTPTEGIPLFNGETPIAGDITAFFNLYDVGTEVNEEPGVGGNQIIRQQMPNSGATENGAVSPVADGFSYPAPGSFRVTINPIAKVENL